MPLPTSGPISLAMIRQQYGGSAPDSLSEYYRGGAYVPNTSANSTVPTSGAISLSSFYGQGGAVGGALAASNGGAFGYRFIAEPAPSTASVSAEGNVLATGGSGSYTCTWSHVSGSTAIPTPGANVFKPSFSASVFKNSSLSAVKRCTVNDGVSTVTTDMQVILEYQTDI